MSDRHTWPIGASSCYKGSIEPAVLQEYADSGIAYLELSTASLPYYTEVLDLPHKANGIVRDATTYGVTIQSIHLPFAPFTEIDLSSLDEQQRRYTLSVMRDLIAVAGDAGIGIAVIHPSGEPIAPADRGEALRHAQESLAELSAFAHRAGVRLAVENLPRTCLGNTAEEIAALLKAAPQLYACFDTNHCCFDPGQCAQQPNPAFIRALGGRLITLHVSDYDGYDEKHWLPGRGLNDWPALLAALEEIGYDGVFLYEISQENAGDLQRLKENHRQLCGLAD